jgi:hypothetical protein
MQLWAPTPVGDVLDRISILELKQERLLKPEARANAAKEGAALLKVWIEAGLPEPKSMEEYGALREVNGQLWEVEDCLRLLEAKQSFDAEFVRLARLVYQTNDRRAALKRTLNLKFQSAFIEEKQHPDYPCP